MTVHSGNLISHVCLYWVVLCIKDTLSLPISAASHHAFLLYNNGINSIIIIPNGMTIINPVNSIGLLPPIQTLCKALKKPVDVLFSIHSFKLDVISR